MYLEHLISTFDSCIENSFRQEPLEELSIHLSIHCLASTKSTNVTFPSRVVLLFVMSQLQFAFHIATFGIITIRNVTLCKIMESLQGLIVINDYIFT